MKVAFRVDAHARIGTGHLVRCATLATALRERGAEVRLLCRGLPPAWQQWLTERGLPWQALPDAPAHTPAADDPPHAAWLGADAAADARQTVELLAAHGPWDWLVVDHYALDARWEAAVRPAARRLLAIDDLADRRHATDVLLDVNLGADAPGRYDGRLASGTRCWLGPRHALLAPAFAAAHGHARHREGPVQRVLVFFGGVDAGRATGKVLRALDSMRRDGLGPFIVDAVVGALNPDRAALVDFCARRPGWACHVQTDRMAELMAAADLAIGAGGTALWECCAVGVPAILVPQAANQRVQVGAAADAGLVCAPAVHGDGPEGWRAQIEALWMDPRRRAQLSAAGLRSVDGRGAERVSAAMCRPPLQMRPATAADSDFVLAGRNADAVRRVSHQPDPVSPEAHAAWFARVLADSQRALLIGCLDDEPVGVLRWDIDPQAGAAQVSLYLAPGRAGQGLGSELLAAGEDWLQQSHPQVGKLTAEVLAGNASSTRLFAQAGYAPHYHALRKTLTPRP